MIHWARRTYPAFLLLLLLVLASIGGGFHWGALRGIPGIGR
ncbi:MAG: hypothetical protein ACRDOF_06580 [Gaiellaceae bacterium]